MSVHSIQSLHYITSTNLVVQIVKGARGTRLAASAVTIQAAYRGMAVRRELRRIRAAASKIQVLSSGLCLPC